MSNGRWFRVVSRPKASELECPLVLYERTAFKKALKKGFVTNLSQMNDFETYPSNVTAFDDAKVLTGA